MMELQTSIGKAKVLHRLAVAVEARDALSNRLIDSLVTARYRRRPTPTNPEPGWLPMTRRGTARFTLRHQLTATTPLPDLQIVVNDPSRRYVPRRFTITPWTLAEVAEPDPVTDSQPFIEPQSRLLRVWLLPGSAYPLPRTATVIRGRITQDDRPKRWARVQGTTPTSVAGWAHTDERGEFVLPIIDAGADLTRVTTKQITVTLRVIGTPTNADPAPPPTVPTPGHKLGHRGVEMAEMMDLISEVIARSSNPATPAELDNDVLRGIAVPAGYKENATLVPPETIPVGTETYLTQAVVFVPQP